MRDARVVAEIKPATREQRGEMRQRKIAREPDGPVAPGRCEGVDLRVLGLAADEKHARLGFAGEQPATEGAPIFQRPAFPRAPAARMDGNQRRVVRAEKCVGKRPVLGARVDRGRVVFEEKCEALQRAGELLGGVRGVVEFRVGGEQVFHARAPEVGLEKAVGIEKVADDLLEAGEVFRQVGREFRARDEEAGHRRVFDGAHAVRIAPAFREGNDMAVAEDFEMRRGEVFAQQADRREREDEVANGPTANDKDARLRGHDVSRRNCVAAPRLPAVWGESAERALTFPLLRPIPRDGAHAVRVMRFGAGAGGEKDQHPSQGQQENDSRHNGYSWPLSATAQVPRHEHQPQGQHPQPECGLQKSPGRRAGWSRPCRGCRE